LITTKENSNDVEYKNSKSNITDILIKSFNNFDELNVAISNDSIILMAGISYTIDSAFLHSIDSINNLIIKYYNFLSIPFTNHNNIVNNCYSLWLLYLIIIIVYSE